MILMSYILFRAVPNRVNLGVRREAMTSKPLAPQISLGDNFLRGNLVWSNLYITTAYKTTHLLPRVCPP